LVLVLWDSRSEEGKNLNLTARIGDRDAEKSLGNVFEDGVESSKDCREVSEGRQDHLLLESLRELTTTRHKRQALNRTHNESTVERGVEM
jgi:hypothetical protein